jgi:hypothetical protein
VSGYGTAFAVSAAIALAAMVVVVALLPDRRIGARADALATARRHVGTRSAVALEVAASQAGTGVTD